MFLKTVLIKGGLIKIFNAGIFLIGPLETNFNDIRIEIYICFIRENAFENDRKLAAISSWPQWHSKCRNLEYDCTDIILPMCTTECMFVLPMAQVDLLVVLFLFIFSHPHLLTRVVRKEDIIAWWELNMNDERYKPLEGFSLHSVLVCLSYSLNKSCFKLNFLNGVF